MRVGIYNRWLGTLGGGEKVTLSIASRLSRLHDVEVLTHTDVSLKAAERRFDLDLAGVTPKLLGLRSPRSLTELTRGYDLFVNASYRDFFPTRAARSAALIYFPPAPVSTATRFRRQLAWHLRSALMLPLFMDGAQRSDFGGRPPVWTLDATANLGLAQSARAYELIFTLAPTQPGVTGARFEIDQRVVGRETFSKPGRPGTRRLRVEPAEAGSPSVLSIVATGDAEAVGSSEPCFRLSGLRGVGPRLSWTSLLSIPLVRRLSARLQDPPPTDHLFRSSLSSFDAVWLTSQYAADWFERWWGRKGSVLYPYVDTNRFRPGEKKKSILSVGRFHAGGHNKNHLAMIGAFKDLARQSLPDWRLHLVGGNSPGALDQAHFQRIQDAASQAPVTLHPNAAPDVLAELYSSSPVYWHAAGFGEDELGHPERFEHFGIATVQALASGSVPVVFGKGGQPEIVEHGKNGYLWNDLAQLRRWTLELASDDSRRVQLAAAGRLSSRRFERSSFNQRLDQLMSELEPRVR